MAENWTKDMESTRIDKWLWAIRMTSTRQDATELCKAGHVRINDKPAKAANTVRPGDKINVRLHAGDKSLEVVSIIEKRVGYQVAVTCYIDHTPPAEKDELYVPIFQRDKSTGRPTKKDRRELDRLRKNF